MNKLTISLLIYSSKEAEYVPLLFDSLKKQTFQDWELLIIDNASDGDILSLVEEHTKQIGRPYRIIKNNANLGFAAGHNVAFKEVRTEYFLLQNPDMYLLPDVLENMVTFLDEQKNAAAVAPRLMRWDFEKVKFELEHGREMEDAAKVGFTTSIDAVGVRLFRNRRAVEWLTQYMWSKDSESEDVRRLYEKSFTEVFGVSGAFPMFRKNVLDKVLLPGGNLFDPTYHSYKEDLDLAYRMRNAGYTSYVILKSAAYHDRTGAGPKKHSDFAAIKNKKNQTKFIRFHSYKNHLRTLYKNEYWQNVLLDLPYIFWYEAKKFGFILLTDPVTVLKGWFEIFKHFGYMRRARKAILESRKMYWKGLRRWF
jgi:GT2 family glycosyltransferase